jgi:hypothetical protein
MELPKFNDVFIDTASVIFHSPNPKSLTYLKKTLPMMKHKGQVSCFYYLNTDSLKNALQTVQMMGERVNDCGETNSTVRVDLSFDTQAFNKNLLTERNWEYSSRNDQWEYETADAKVKYYHKKAQVSRMPETWLKRKIKHDDRMTAYPVQDYDFWRYEVSTGETSPKGLKKHLEKIRKKAALQ